MDKVVVTSLGLALIGAIVWFFWGPRKEGYRATVTSSGYHAGASEFQTGRVVGLLGDRRLRGFREEREVARGCVGADRAHAEGSGHL
jgi:hypothetical protein